MVEYIKSTMPVLTSYLTILFVDISGSTALFERLGDTTARLIIAKGLTTLTQIIERFNGTVIKSIGDELMATFKNPDQAIEAADNMHRELSEILFPPANIPLSVRIGLHYGSVLLENKDIFGDAVNVAARIVALAKARQTLTTSQLLNALSSIDQTSFRLIERAQVKGKQNTLDIYERLWEQDINEVTVIAHQPILSNKTAQPCLKLSYQQQIITLNSNIQTSAQIGRDMQSTLRISSAQASRLHARIEYHKAKFILTDQSTNGTFVITNQGTTRLHRDAMELPKQGWLGCGTAVPAQHPEAIQFEWLLR